MLKRMIAGLTEQDRAKIKKFFGIIAILSLAWVVFHMGKGWGRVTADHPVVLEKELQVVTAGSVEVFGVSNIAVPIDGASSDHVFMDSWDEYYFSGKIDTLWIFSRSECDNQTGLEIQIAPAWKGSERQDICVHYGTYLAVSTLDNSHWDPEQNQLNGFPGQDWVQIKVERRPPPTATPQPTNTPETQPSATSQSN